MTKHFRRVDFPIPLGLKNLLFYRREWLGKDCLAGVTVAAYAIPQCMAYADLAGVDPVIGLWTLIPAALVYALLGSSPQLSIGPESTTAVMTAAAIAPLVTAQSENYASLAALLALLVGLVCIVGYLARLGFLANLLSKPILIGYMSGVAVIMITGQLGKISGLSIRENTVFEELGAFFRGINQWHWPTLSLALFLLLFLFTVQRYFPRVPGPLLAVLLGTLAVVLLHLDQKGVAVVGKIADTLPYFALPELALDEILPLVTAAVGIALVGYSDNVLTARAFAVRHNHEIDANQEFLALGVANLVVGCCQGFPISSSASRTAIGDSLGSKSQIFSLVAVVGVIMVLLSLRPLLALFPKAALGAIVIYAACKLVDIPAARRLKRFRSSEFNLAVFTMVGVLTTGILNGVVIAIGLSVIDLLARIAHPHDAVLGSVPGVAGLHDIEDWPGAQTIPGLVIYRYDAPLFFANAIDFKQRTLTAIAAEKNPVEWFVLNTEALGELDSTAMDTLEELFKELSRRGIVFALARVKHDLYLELKRSRLLDKISEDRIYYTLPAAIEAFQKRGKDETLNEV
jgi:sulfate permease, SulP family